MHISRTRSPPQETAVNYTERWTFTRCLVLNSTSWLRELKQFKRSKETHL